MSSTVVLRHFPSTSSVISIDSMEAATADGVLKRKRREVAVFIKVLLDYLQKNAPNLKDAVKSVVTECIRRNRQGDPRYDNLSSAIKAQARQAVGEWHWTRAKLIILYARQSTNQRKQRESAARTA